MKSEEIRSAFLTFFESKGHTIVPSAPIVVKNDPTLMFTNAGMNQFKDVFLGNEEAESKRVADTQKCLRVSGKHNDLEEVGVDTYHHTMFEMLGNWSFGDYYKNEAIDWACELLTVVYKIDRDRLYVTVFEGDEGDKLAYDQEAFDAWKMHVPEDRILAADKKDNFWEMGDVGPCGPCSEIHVDMRSDEERAKTPGRDLVNRDHPQVIEVWNLVFMELLRKADGSLQPLKEKHIDTGMGFERLCMVLQGKSSTYDTDVFTPLIQFLEKETGKKYTYGTDKKDVAFRVLADHIRAVSFAIADGQIPSNTGAGYVIRRILRRAVRYAYSFLEVKEPVLYRLFGVLEKEIGGFFKELRHSRDTIAQVIREEAEAFMRTLSKGMERIEHILQDHKEQVIPGRLVFELYDTYGFPADLTALILSEYQKTYDREEFEKALEEQKKRSRKDAEMDTSDWNVLQEAPSTEFVGYDTLDSPLKLVRWRKVEQKGKTKFHLVFDRTPFYPEGGGQIGDTGYLISGGAKWPIENTFRENNLIIHVSPKSPEGIEGELIGVVSELNRRSTARNHSATHLLHHALRAVLGTHVEQKGSLVEKDYLRFDFSHFSKMTPEELREVELMVNAMIRQNIPLMEHRTISMESAMEMGALALFGEKYGDKVRMIEFGDSRELCGGTHVQGTGEIGFFKIVSEGSVAAGVRRVEALTGDAAEAYVFNALEMLDRIRQEFKGNVDPAKGVHDLVEENNRLKKEMEQLERERAQTIKQDLIQKAREVNGVRFIAEKVELSPAHVKDIAFQLKSELSPLFLVLATQESNKATISVALSDELVSRGMNSGQIVRELASLIQGGGGGQPFFATAGGKNPAGIPEALKKAESFLSQG
jgi:alanyl-tRNA synthetase